MDTISLGFGSEVEGEFYDKKSYHLQKQKSS
jgi:hypothetical protein